MTTRQISSAGAFAFCVLWLLIVQSNISHAATKVSYLVLAETVEPLMIVRDGDPMAGGLFTEIVQRVFENSDYIVVPRVLPWQRMKDELRSTSNWVGYGFQDGFEEGIPFELASPPIFPFNHVAATLAENELSIKTPEDVFGRIVILVENFHYPGLDSYLTNPTAGTGNGQIPSVRAFDPEGTLQMLKHRRGEVVFDWQVRLVYNLSAANLKPDEIRFQDASGIIPTKDMYFAYSPNWSKSFKEFVHRRLLALRADGTLDAIFQKYGGTSDLIR